MAYPPFFSAVIIGLFLLPAAVSNTLSLMGRRVKLLEVPVACAVPWCHQPFIIVDSKYGGLVLYLWTMSFSCILGDSPNFLLSPTYKVMSIFSPKSVSLVAGIDLLYLCISCHKETKIAVCTMCF